jgi:hypothetical protein
MNSLNVSAKQLRRAAEIKDKIEALENELSSILGNGKPAVAAPAASSKKRTISAAGRAKIAAAARARWARVRAEKKK